jgi:hypothetical protein
MATAAPTHPQDVEGDAPRTGLKDPCTRLLDMEQQMEVEELAGILG